MIRVIQQSTAERKKETKELFELIKPYLDKGYSFNNAIHEVTGFRVRSVNRGWHKDLIEYGKSQGYDYNEYSWKRTPKKIK